MPNPWGDSWGDSWGNSWFIPDEVIPEAPDASIYSKNMRQVATYWAPNANDGFGGVTFQDPINIRCRWQDKLDLVRNAVGQEQPSTAIVYPAFAVEVKGYLALGDHTDTADPRELTDAYQIINVQQSPSLKATQILYKAFL